MLQEEHMLQDMANAAFVVSGGNVGSVIKFVEYGNEQTALYSDILRYTGPYGDLLNKVKRASEQAQNEKGVHPASYPWYVHVKAADLHVDQKHLYDAADHGAITYNDADGLVRFMTPALADYVAHAKTVPRWLDPCMRCRAQVA
ncbi:hypothetical protein AB1Y20_004014 [Prymnesium parvum]